MANKRGRRRRTEDWNSKNRRCSDRFVDQVSRGVRTISLEEESVTERMEKLKISVKTHKLRNHRHRQTSRGRDLEEPARSASMTSTERSRPKTRKREESPNTHEREWKRRVVHMKWNQNNPARYLVRPIYPQQPYGQRPQQKAMIVGHSLVNRLKKSIIKEGRGRKINWAKSLDVDREGINPYVHGIPGAKIGSMKEFEEEIWKVRPKSVIIDLGTNDCCANTPARYLAIKLVKEMNYWLNSMPFLQSLTWCHIIPRTKTGNKKLDARAFKKKATIFNRYVVEATKARKEMHHWKHRGLTMVSEEELCDGIHLKSDGIWKYQKSMSRIIKWSIKNVY